MKQKSNITVRRDYFGAANTSNGFYNLFGEIFSPESLEKIYILKGGPGCGKSTAIRRISEKGTSLGYNVENIFCSSSPMSFDGVIIPELSVAVLDGTAPHTVDPVYPAVCETILNLGEAWDTVRAKEIDTEIRELTGKKKAAYKKAYAYLSSCSSANSVIRGCMSQYALENKLLRSVQRLCSKQKIKQGEGSLRRVFTDCNSALGRLHLSTFENLSKNRYFIKDFGNISCLYFNALTKELTQRGTDITVALDPLEPDYITGIYIPSIETSFTVYDDEYALKLDRQQLPYKVINTARFCDNDKFKKQKTYYKYAEKSKKILFAGALRELENAGRLHDEIEKLYYGITDYDVVEKISSKLEKEIFK